jgi:hypothetical protein
MRRTTKANRTIAKQDQVIEYLYQKYCSGMQISILRIPVLFAMARKLIIDGKTHQEVGEAMVKFVQDSQGGRTMS